MSLDGVKIDLSNEGLDATVMFWQLVEQEAVRLSWGIKGHCPFQKEVYGVLWWMANEYDVEDN